MRGLIAAIPTAMVLTLAGNVLADDTYKMFTSNNSAQGALAVSLSGACTGRIELNPRFYVTYLWTYSVLGDLGANNKKSGSNKTREGGMNLHWQQAGVSVNFPDFVFRSGDGINEISYGGSINAGTDVTNKTNFSVVHKGSAETFKLSGPAEMSIEKVLYQMYNNGNISCKGDYDFAELMREAEENNDLNLPYDLRANSNKQTISLTHAGSNGSNEFSLKYQAQLELDVANVCTGTAQNSAWSPSPNFSLKSLTCKAGSPVKVKVSFNASGNSAIPE